MHVANIREALDKLHAVVPRMLVNLVPVFDISPLRHLNKHLMCDTFQWYVTDLSKCKYSKKIGIFAMNNTM